MEPLRLLIQNLILTVILAVFLEMMLPKGEMRRYTKMVLGLMVIVAVIQAMHGLSGGLLFKEINDYVWRESNIQQGKTDIMDQGRKINDENRKQALDQYRKGIEKQITALAELNGKYKLTGSEIKIQDDPAKKDFGRIQEINLVLSRETGSDKLVKSVDSILVNAGNEKARMQASSPPPGFDEETKNTSSVVANFYNLSTDQVRVNFNINE